jgi:hypothetical protein
MTLIGYPQVSAIDQDPEAQTAALGVPRIDNLRASALALIIAATRSESALVAFRARLLSKGNLRVTMQEPLASPHAL